MTQQHPVERVDTKIWKKARASAEHRVSRVLRALRQLGKLGRSQALSPQEVEQMLGAIQAELDATAARFAPRAEVEQQEDFRFE